MSKKKQVAWKDYNEALTDRLGYRFRMNDLDDTIEVNGRRLTDGSEAEILMKMNDLGFTGADWIRRAYTATAYQNRYNPVVDFLTGVQWDGKDWIAEFERYVWDKHPKIQYDNGSVRPVFGAWLQRWGIGAVAKVLQTGTIRGQNVVLTLAGPQNIGKSTLARFLCPMSDEYFIESSIDPDSNETARYLATKLCWEAAELGATTKRTNREALKSILTRQDTTFRPPYAHHPVTKHCITSFIGTINPETGFLNDPTGHRRFLPVEITKIDHSYVSKIDNRQLWAQFVALYKAGESPRLTPEEQRIADAIRAQHEVEDGFAGFILKYYDVDSKESDWSETTTEIVSQLTLNSVQGANPTNIGLSLKRLGLEKAERARGGQVRWKGIKRNGEGNKVRR